MAILLPHPHRGLLIAITLLTIVPLSPAQSAQIPSARIKTENVLLITFDGLRWQELFGGADRRLFDREHGGVRNVETLEKRFWVDDAEERRLRLLPFFWSVVAKQGMVLGDPSVDSSVTVTNGRYFSYPGYNEILTGSADDRIDSNDKRPNPNVTVLEHLHRRQGFEGRVAAFGSWDVFPFIVNEERSGVYVNAGWKDLQYAAPRSSLAELNRLAQEVPHSWAGVRWDLVTFEGALGFLHHRRPRLLYVAFGETDDWAHDGRYDLYLDSAQRTDDYIRRLWEAVQTLPDYRDKTTLILSSDHGRGDDGTSWRSHGTDIEGAEKIWLAVLGPDTPATGIVAGARATQGQVAASVAALLGLDLSEVEPQAAPVLDGLFR